MFAIAAALLLGVGPGWADSDPNRKDRGKRAERGNRNTEKVDLSKTTMIPGFFDQSLTQATRETLPIRTAAIIWVDCDLYESTVPVLNFVTDYVQDGTLIVFDDWFFYRGDPQRGQRRAFSEWLGNNPAIKATEFHKYHWYGMSFLLHRSC